MNFFVSQLSPPCSSSQNLPELSEPFQVTRTSSPNLQVIGLFSCQTVVQQSVQTVSIRPIQFRVFVLVWSHIISKTPYCIYRLRTATQFLTPLIAFRAGGSRGWEGVEPSVRSLKLLGHSFRGVLCPFTFHIIPIKKKEKEEYLYPRTITMELSLRANHP